jgi:mono/diheme cytochrome c family protein
MRLKIPAERLLIAFHDLALEHIAFPGVIAATAIRKVLVKHVLIYSIGVLEIACLAPLMMRSGFNPRYTLSLPPMLGALLTVAAHSATAPPVVPAAAAALPPAVKSFFERHCYECHDADTRKGDLDLTHLTSDFTHGERSRQWTTLFDRVESGEMPPTKKARPADAELKSVLDWVGNGIRASDVAYQKSQGRTHIRRLSRVEYEHTVHDLLGIDIDLKEMLPEDVAANGFDNQDAGLSVSAVLVERYLEAADAALDAVLVRGPKPATTTKRYSYLDEGGQIAVAYRDHKYIIPLKDAAVFCTENHPPKILAQFKAPIPGKYRFKISCYTYDNKINRPLTMLVYAGSQSVREGKTFLSGVYDVPREPAVVEFVERLEKKDTIRLVVNNLLKQYPKKLEDFKGPGLAVQWVEVEGPLVESWPPSGQIRLLGGVDLDKGTLADAEKVIRAFLPRAFRRPTADAEATPYVQLVAAQLSAGANFEQALRAGLKAVLCSPDFLYFKADPGALNDYALASRLSAFLWSSMPDEPLLDAAAAGRLHDPQELRRQTERMLADPKAQHFTEQFTGQWLSLRNIKATTPDTKLYPDYDEVLELSMLQETHLFFDEVLKNDLSLTNFVNSDFAMLNARLARLYGIDGIEGQTIRKVALPPGNVRGGVMTQAAVLKVTANGTNTSPVMRGVWVMDHILGRPVPPPPKNVPAIEPDIRGAKTIREQLDKHREVVSCAVCHQKIDPAGYALESFDVIGGFRDNYRVLAKGFNDRVKDRDGNSQPFARGPKVDAGDTLADGRSFTNVTEFKKLLLADKDAFAKALAEKLLVYATGHGLEFADRDAVKQIVERVREKQYGFRSLIHEVVQSAIFRNK